MSPLWTIWQMSTGILVILLLTACGYDVVDGGRFEVIPESEFEYVDLCTDSEKETLRGVVESNPHLSNGSIASIVIDTASIDASFLEWESNGQTMELIGLFEFNSGKTGKDIAVFEYEAGGIVEYLDIVDYHRNEILISKFRGTQSIQLYAPNAGPLKTTYLSCPYQREVVLKRVD